MDPPRLDPLSPRGGSQGGPAPIYSAEKAAPFRSMTTSALFLIDAQAVPEGALRCVEAGGRKLLVANTGGRYFVTDDTCSHEDASLSTGSLQGETVKCPLHGSRFCLRSGRPLDEPADEPIRTYPVELRDGGLWVHMDGAGAAD